MSNCCLLCHATIDGLKQSWCRSCHPIAIAAIHVRPKCLGIPTPNWLVGTLHVGFVGVVETEEHLAALAEPGFLAQATAAKSKIFSTSKIPVPINQLAATVSGIKKILTEVAP